MDAETDDLLRASGLAGDAHHVDEDLLEAILRDDYGLTGSLTRLATEKDATYRMTGARGDAAPDEFLVKISHPDERVDVVRCQIDAVGWIEQHDPGIPVQTIRPALDGAPWRRLATPDGRFGGILRVHRFIPGRLLADESSGSAQRRAVGAMLGRVDTALGAFTHPGEAAVLAWDLTRFSSLEPLVELESDAGRRRLAVAVFEAFADRVRPHMGSARRQVLHGDFSPYNVVVDPGAVGYVTGVIDFGDTHRGPVVFDPAVLLGNHLLDAPRHPWEHARDLLDGYRDVFPLTDEEVGMTAVASAARVTLRALLATWRVEQGTDRADYVLRHARHDWGRVENVIELGFDTAHDYLTHAV